MRVGENPYGANKLRAWLEILSHDSKTGGRIRAKFLRESAHISHPALFAKPQLRLGGDLVAHHPIPEMIEGARFI